MKRLAVALGALALLAACSDDDDDDASATTTAAEETTTTDGGPTTTAVEETTTSAPAPEGDPLGAAQDWLDLAFPDNTATLGEFQQGDARSGEVPVFRPNEGGGQANLASTLLLRLDDADEWQVIGAVSEFVTIEEPTDEHAPSGVVSGVGRGFEATLVARSLGLDGVELGTGVTSGGAQAEPEPYSVNVPVVGTEPGTEIYLVVNGGTGLDGDTGEFSAVLVTLVEA